MGGGIIPSWTKDPAAAAKMINARSETAATKPAFRDALSCRRCLIPADGFYEWQRVGKMKHHTVLRLVTRSCLLSRESGSLERPEWQLDDNLFRLDYIVVRKIAGEAPHAATAAATQAGRSECGGLSEPTPSVAILGARGQHRRELEAVLTFAVCLLAEDKPLSERNRDHPLAGEWQDRRECHVKPELLLIYRKPDAEVLQLVRLGSHSELLG